MAALAVLAACSLGVVADPPPAKKDPPKQLPEEIIAAWKEAGADVRWMWVEKDGWINNMPEKVGVGGDLLFRFPTWKAGMLAKLPSPAAPFGLDLGRTQV